MVIVAGPVKNQSVRCTEAYYVLMVFSKIWNTKYNSSKTVYDDWNLKRQQ